MSHRLASPCPSGPCPRSCLVDVRVEHQTKKREFESIFDKNSAILDVPLETFDESDVEPLMPGSVRTELPVFMLDVAACPGGVVPLHIFEMRYRQLFNDIGTKDNRFGMLVTDPTTGRPCKYGAVMEVSETTQIRTFPHTHAVIMQRI